jgi:Fe2+ transport system protein FeoA
LDEELTEWLETEGRRVGTGSDIDLSDSMRSRLSDLGYLDHEM